MLTFGIFAVICAIVHRFYIADLGYLIMFGILFIVTVIGIAIIAAFYDETDNYWSRRKQSMSLEEDESLNLEKPLLNKTEGADSTEKSHVV
jgi:hypothetical protein